MRVLYKELGLDAREAAEITADVVGIVLERMPDVEAVDFLAERYTGKKLCFAILMLGRLAGMSFALSEPDKARTILADFSRLVSALQEKGREHLVKLLQEEILEEVYSEVNRLKDAI
ncbi:MAG: hypothetical protein DRO98_01190 [Archaeoglobales archaeon]|nr:MAG: hypothetical protein DRO98_01190 [Archaeoglobales archaeon]